ncbi:MAG: PD-(D/E)XK nuclease family protein, partial [Bacteroidaceae bacterium]|nr:PD-(D/E)XK nuclease family protein [Bacteroidaceae bacterium]
GFNVLDKVEESLFALLQEKGKARFYWDYDTYYLDPTQKNNPMEAGHFLARNIQRFGNALPSACFENMKEDKVVEFVSAPTENAQVRHVSTWLKENLTANAKETAVVLCNEQLLEPILHVLPDCKINITMGFPMSDTPMFSFVQALCRLYLEGFSTANASYRLESLTSVLLHPYTRMLFSESASLLQSMREKRHFLVKPEELHANEAMKLMFPERLADLSPIAYVLTIIQQTAQAWGKLREQQDPTFAPLYQEALFKTYTLCNRLDSLVEDGLLNVNNKTLTRFLFQLMNSQSIPFHGEPAIGLQVMGVLETRNLDFRHIIMVSANEGMLPKSGAEASFIPYNLRKAFGMTLIEQKMAVYAYYFYRLIQRAERITLLYNNNTSGLQKGEMSRFMQQYLVEHPHNHTVRQIALNASMTTDAKHTIVVEKTPEMVDLMLRDNSRHALSPSALNRYIDCPLRYYFQYVARMKVEEEVTDAIDSALFGTLFHRCSELVYKDMMRLDNSTIRTAHIEDALKNDAKLMAIVKFALKENLFLVAVNSGLAKDSPE